jgi:copper oxidase (laccase) domain-containing protein
MLQRTTHPNGVVTYQSPLLRAAGIPHAFSTRLGGISKTPYDSLNFGNPPPSAAPPDAPANIQENFRRLQTALGLAPLPRAWVTQVHGSRVELVAPEPAGEYAETLEAEIRDRFTGQTAADGMVTGVAGVLLTIRVADCVPVLLASQNGIVAAVHAGWRGVVSGIVEMGLQTLRAAAEKRVKNGTDSASFGSDQHSFDAEDTSFEAENDVISTSGGSDQGGGNSAQRGADHAQIEGDRVQTERNRDQKIPNLYLTSVMAAIGPGISGANFEVGEEVAEAFAARDLSCAVVRQTGQRPHVDLQVAIRKILERNGVKRIDGNDLCTFHNTAEFFSHRRENGRTGRMVAAIAARYNLPS